MLVRIQLGLLNLEIAVEVDVSKLMKEVEDYENRYRKRMSSFRSFDNINYDVLVAMAKAKYASNARTLTSQEIIEAKNKAIEQRNQYLSQLNTNKRK